MRNIAISTLKYTGIVTLSQYIGDKKIKIAKLHNEGGNSLFNFFANCLIGDFDMASATRPTKVMLIKRTNSGEPGESGTRPDYGYEPVAGGGGVFHLLTKPEKVYDAGIVVGKVRYSFIIPKDIVGNLTGFDNLYLGLYADGTDALSSPGDYAAVCKLELDNTNIASTALAVDWELVVSNINVDEQKQ